MSEKNLKFSILFDYYKNLLKKNQAEVIELYYNQDFSLSEIAEELNISRAGIHDTLKRAEKNLIEFEDKLFLSLKSEKNIKSAEKIIEIANNITSDSLSSEIEIIIREAESILNEG